MTNFTILIGHIKENDKNGKELQIVTPVGEVLNIKSEAQLEFYPIEASGEQGLQRILLKETDVISISMTAKSLWDRTKQSQLGITTVFKYYDDSGCVSKSRDDGYVVEV